jgi:SAM-dependent methyltransferase
VGQEGRTSLDDLLVCPVCHGTLETLDTAVVCGSCGRGYARTGVVLDATPNPPPDGDVASRWPLWEALQHNFLVAADEIPEHSLSVGERKDASEFASFAELEGIVLDVGCGPQEEPSYAGGWQGRFVGIDPVAGAPHRAFDFVQGLGEYLPFRDATFDRVLFATSLDHMLSPQRALAEARRVLKPLGTVNVWFGEIDAETKAPSRGGSLVKGIRHPLWGARRLRARMTRATGTDGPDYLRTLDTPDGAVDMFHALHLDRPLIEGWLRGAGLRMATTDTASEGRSRFLQATR